jgi:hypothetical protein
VLHARTYVVHRRGLARASTCLTTAPLSLKAFAMKANRCRH